jgi:hypothetical protein
MTGDVETGEGSLWRRFVKKHWGIVVVFGVAAIVAFVGVVYVFLWFVGNAQSSGLVPSSLGLWTMRNLVDFILHTIFWELLFIGIAVAVFGLIGWQWWRRLPAEERWDYRFGRRSRRTKGGGGASLFFFIAFCIKVYADGNWNVPIATFTLNYVVDSFVLILAVTAIIVGIPGAIAGTWWIRREMRKT